MVRNPALDTLLNQFEVTGSISADEIIETLFFNKPHDQRTESGILSIPARAKLPQSTVDRSAIQVLLHLRRALALGARWRRRLYKNVQNVGQGQESRTRPGRARGRAEKCGLILSPREVELFFKFFDLDNSGSISLDELLRAVKPQLNERRLNILHRAFMRHDITGTGITTVKQLLSAFEPSKHPRVVAGRMSAKEVMDGYIDAFGAAGGKRISLLDFEEYYSRESLQYPTDAGFEGMIRSIWGVSAGESIASDASTGQRILITHRDGSQTVEYVEEAIGAGGEMPLCGGFMSLARKILPALSHWVCHESLKTDHDTRSSININRNSNSSLLVHHRTLKMDNVNHRYRRCRIGVAHSLIGATQDLLASNGVDMAPAANLSVCLERIRKNSFYRLASAASVPSRANSVRRIVQMGVAKFHTLTLGSACMQLGSTSVERRCISYLKILTEQELAQCCTRNSSRASVENYPTSPRSCQARFREARRLARRHREPRSRKNAYDVSKHPDVLFSKRHAQQILRIRRYFYSL